MRYYVYIIWNGHNLPIYVGKGQGNRLYHHEINARRNNLNSPIVCKLKTMLDKKESISYSKVFFTDNEMVAYDIEKHLIKSYGRKDLKTGTLLNLTDGGEGNSGGKIKIYMYDENGKFIRDFDSSVDASMEIYNTPERRTNITSRCRNGGYILYGDKKVRFSYEYMKDLQIPHHKLCKKVAQIDKDEKIIKIHNSVRDAAKYIGGDNSFISAVARGKYKQGYGYYWRYISTVMKGE